MNLVRDVEGKKVSEVHKVFMLVYNQQKNDYRRCEPGIEWSRGLSDAVYEKGWGTDSLLRPNFHQ